MCGIAGYIDQRRSTDEATLRQMTDALAHRGPDGSGYETIHEADLHIGLGHRRLAILELSELGKQPMEWNGLSIVFNGEIYNFAEIREELVTLGHEFLSHSDTEVILHAYGEWREKCLDRFIGMFAFVIYDKPSQEIFIARDRTGVKPLYLYQNNDLILFASELKAFHEHPRFEKTLDPRAALAFLQYGNVPAPHCIFRNCTKLKPGHFIRAKASELDTSVQQKYWSVYDAYNAPKLYLPYEELKAETLKLLRSACLYRMVSDVPVGVFLSGGYDSTCVTALIGDQLDTKLKTYTISVPDAGLNEAPYAKDIARHLGTDHTEIACTANEALDTIPKLPFHYDEPFADSSAIPTMLVSASARKEVTVALSADGGDEVFAGYNRYEMIMRYGSKLSKIPGFARKGIAGIMEVVPADSIPVLRNKYNFAQRYEKVKSVLRNSSAQNVMLSLTQLFTDDQLEKLMTDLPAPLETAYESAELSNFTDLSYIMAIDYETYLPDDILQKVDRASMSVSLESREPLLDHRIIEYLARVPDDMKYRDGSKKWLLKQIVHDYVPQSLMDRPKMGFSIPIESWMANELRDLVESTLSDEKIAATGLFRTEEVDRLKKAFFAGKKELGVKVWYLLCFMMWYERWGK
jgi:asparagine synthase (glutamine-hydrolysing)